MDVEYNFLTICRTCLLEDYELYDLFSNNNLCEQCPVDILLKCTPIEVTFDDELPHKICKSCLQQATKAMEFQTQCENSQNTLWTYLNRTRNKVKNEINSDDELIDIHEEKHLVDVKLEHNENGVDSPMDFLQVSLEAEPHCESSSEFESLPDKFREPWDDDRKLKPGLERLTCKYCPKTFKYKTSFKKHILIHSLANNNGKISKRFKIVLQKKANQTDKPTKLSATENKTDDSNLNLNIDNTVNRDATSFFIKANLKRRKRCDPRSERKFLCSECGKSFTDSSYLKIHLRTHRDERPYVCDICSRSFKQKTTLNNHKQVHNDIRRHVCTTCGKTFKWLTVLKTHMSSHSDVRKYDCTICGMKFKIKKALSRHLLTHTGEKNYVCPTCGKRFNRASNLRVHHKIHTGEKPFACTVCEKTFLYKHCLQNHLKTHY